MDRLNPPAALNFNGNLKENWRRFKQQFDIYNIASGTAERDDKVQAMTLLHVVGAEAIEVYNTFTWDGKDKEKVADICEKFEAYCNPRKNITYERHMFNTRVQKEGELIDAYVTELKQRAASCEFENLQHSLIKSDSV